jgi:hypothetical protein
MKLKVRGFATNSKDNKEVLQQTLEITEID